MTGTKAYANGHITYSLRHLAYDVGYRLQTYARVATLAKSMTFVHLADTV
jgi:hypothetical protein